MSQDISETLEAIARGDHDPAFVDDGASVYVVVNDHATREEPQVTSYYASDAELARASTHDLVQTLLGRALDSAIRAWRADGVEEGEP